MKQLHSCILLPHPSLGHFQKSFDGRRLTSSRSSNGRSNEQRLSLFGLAICSRALEAVVMEGLRWLTFDEGRSLEMEGIQIGAVENCDKVGRPPLAFLVLPLRRPLPASVGRRQSGLQFIAIHLLSQQAGMSSNDWLLTAAQIQSSFVDTATCLLDRNNHPVASSPHLFVRICSWHGFQYMRRAFGSTGGCTRKAGGSVVEAVEVYGHCGEGEKLQHLSGGGAKRCASDGVLVSFGGKVCKQGAE